MTKYILPIFALLFFLLPQDVGATSYFTDFGAACGGVGTASTTSFCSLDDFTEVARAPGDQVFVRRGTATTTGINQLDFTSDGTIRDPIIISADYDNIWGDFSTSSQTFTVAVGSSTMSASASITGIAAGDWIYVAGDQVETPSAPTIVDKIYSYEVKSVSGTQLTLYFPYNGKQTGAGNSLRVMPDNPIRGNTTDNFVASNFSTDGGWMLTGLDLRGTNSNGIISLSVSGGLQFSDMLLQADGVGASGFALIGDGGTNFFVSKTRAFNVNAGLFRSGIAGVNNTQDWVIELNDVVLDCNSAASSYVINFGASAENTSIVKINNLVVERCTNGYNLSTGSVGTLATHNTIYSRNAKFLGIASTSQIIFGDASSFNQAYIEDANGYIGESYFTSLAFSTTSEKMLTQKSGIVRNASTYSSTFVRPSPYFTNKMRTSMLKLFEYPIYADTTSKTYSVFFNSTSTANWTTDPTASEFWIECEYWAHPESTGTTTRAVKRSTGVIDFNGSTAWQSLSVACQPTASGILYLRGWYAKPQESGVTNAFYVDVTPEIS